MNTSAPFDFDVSAWPPLPPSAGLFVTGTDTGVGKTLIAGGIARLLRETAGGVEVFKPVATGCRSVDGRLVSEDGEFLAACAANARTHEEIVPVRFADPLAPNVAAARAGTRVDVEAILAACAALARSGLPIVVEGVGGLLCPISDEFWVIHLARMLRLPLLIVARAGLGTINHTLLTLQAARSFGLPIAGVILNGCNPDSADPSLPSNPAQIEFLGRVKVLAMVPHDPLTSVQSATLGPPVLDALRPPDWHSLASPR